MTLFKEDLFLLQSRSICSARDIIMQSKWVVYTFVPPILSRPLRPSWPHSSPLLLSSSSFLCTFFPWLFFLNKSPFQKDLFVNYMKKTSMSITVHDGKWREAFLKELLQQWHTQAENHQNNVVSILIIQMNQCQFKDLFDHPIPMIPYCYKHKSMCTW